MNRFKTWLTKKIILTISVVKRIKAEGVIFRYFIKKFVSDQKTIFLAFINKSTFLNKTISFIKRLLHRLGLKFQQDLSRLPLENRNSRASLSSWKHRGGNLKKKQENLDTISIIKITSKIFNVLNKIPLINKILPLLNKKYFSFLALAFLISLLIFYFMSLLISTGKNPTKPASQNISINFLLNAKLNELELRSRRLPKKLKQEEPPPETPKLKIQQTELQKPQMNSQLPQLDLPDDFQSDEKGAGVSAYTNQDREGTPIFRIQPLYPRRAALQNIEGFVILQFDITAGGYTDNITVIQASPPQIFNSSAVQALRKWKYKPKIENGKPVRQKNLKVQLDFKLRDQ